MKHVFTFHVIACLLLATCSFGSLQAKDYPYQTFANDPLKARIYTLDNGLKVYLTVNTETPRIQTFIAVRVGGKNDPSATTGLAHYFEHLMFKGTEQFGTQNYAAEKPLLDQIEAQFEIYRGTTDDAARKAIYHVIDSLSYEASKYSIPNEYDKLMAAIGASGTNAYTGFDMTVYTEDIPSNAVENWAKIQADRFKHNVIRGFHTELETVYEEKNMSLTRDSRKMNEALLGALFPMHPYGTQTVLGTQDHLKNPSIKTIKQYYKTWYVPNNMAVCLSGDFDPDQMIATIDKYFGDMKPNPNLPKLTISPLPTRSAPIVREVYGLEAEMVSLGWPLPPRSSEDSDGIELLSNILYNGSVGLVDIDLNQEQKVLNAAAGYSAMADYSVFMMQARSKEGQTLEEVKNLLLTEIEKLKAGDFDESLLKATVNNYKLYEQQQLEYNQIRADMFVTSFINSVPWEQYIRQTDNMAKLTKADIVRLANKYFTNGYAVIYKRQGADPNEKKIEKPTITPIVMNRDAVSPFLKEIQNSHMKPIEPVFVDFNKDMSKFTTKDGLEVLYKQNTTNDIFSLEFIFETGNNADKALGTAASYFDYLGTSDMTVEEIRAKLYEWACNYSWSISSERSYIAMSGLSENMPKTLDLFEKVLAGVQVNKAIYDNIVADILKSRANAKTNQSTNFSRVLNYAMYGPLSAATNFLSTDELQQMNPQTLIDKLRAFSGYKHRIVYYGPDSPEKLLAALETYHKVPARLTDAPKPVKFPFVKTPTTKIYIAPYQANQIYMSQYSNTGETYNPAIEPTRTLYNAYFGGGMNGIVFQEMREARGLAYSANASLVSPSRLSDPYVMRTQIATQNDKMMQAIATFNEIINDMPRSEAAFKLAKDGLIARLRTQRTTKSAVLSRYLTLQDLGLTTDPNIKLYNDVQNMTLNDVVKFQQEQVKNRTYSYVILGDEATLDMESLGKLGPIQRLTTEEIFGY
ncbi:MAG: insulinase family protein [Prevotellaceae bacterium]|jgi:predicted Zn-dependent peptidase|nr:insulinase family protein [Prevotellaceae bacterium]